MVNAHSYALSIEQILRRVFHFDDRGGLAGLIDADTIETNWYVPIAAGLGYLYAGADETKKVKIESFIEKYGFYLELSMNFIIRFEEKSQEIDGYSIDFDNGEAVFESVIAGLKSICVE